MADQKERMQTYTTYDFKKEIPGITLSSLYIPGLQTIISEKIMAEDRAETIGEVFKKFDTIVKTANKEDVTDEELQSLPELDKWESQIYTLYSLLQYLKFKAKEQGLEIQTETSTTKEEFQKLAKEAFEGNDVTEKLKEMSSKLKIVK
jgi:C4-type Zn-finger protein